MWWVRAGIKSTMDLSDIIRFDTRILQNLLNRLQCLPEQIHVKHFELGMSEGLSEIISTFKALDLKLRQHLGGQSTLCLLNLTFQLPKCTLVTRNICTGLLLIQFNKVVNDMIVKVFTTKVGITSSGQDLKDTVINA